MEIGIPCADRNLFSFFDFLSWLSFQAAVLLFLFSHEIVNSLAFKGVKSVETI